MGLSSRLEDYTVLMKMIDTWKLRKGMNGERKRLRVNRLRDEGTIEEYKQMISEVLKDEWVNVKDDANAEVLETFRKCIFRCNGESGVGEIRGRKKGMHGRWKGVREAVRGERSTY